MESRCAKNLEESYKSLIQMAIETAVLHADDTGIRVVGALQWLHVYSTNFFTVYFSHSKRGKAAMDEVAILTFFSGILSHDFWSSYFTQDGKYTHSMCNAHLFRELKAMLELYGEAWAKKIMELILEIKNKVDTSAYGRLPYGVYAKYHKKWLLYVKLAMNKHLPPERIPGKRGRLKKGKALCLLERLYYYVDDILRFAKDPLVPFDNNQAERDLRMIKTKQKISGCFRSESGVEPFCKRRSYISTVRKQGHNVFHALRMAVLGTPIPFKT